jgi:hypothetical protein
MSIVYIVERPRTEISRVSAAAPGPGHAGAQEQIARWGEVDLDSKI